MTQKAAVIGALVVALVCPWTRADGAADPTWKTYREPSCRVEFKYPPSYQVKASGATDFCALSVSIAEVRGSAVSSVAHVLVEEMERRERQEAARTGTEVSARSFALDLARRQCDADGPDSTRYCPEGGARGQFKTAHGFDGYEIYVTEVHEAFVPKQVRKQTKGPIFALDISDGETIRVVLVNADGTSAAQQATLRSVLDTFRVWGKARRQMPQVVEIGPFARPARGLTIRVVLEGPYGRRPMPLGPATRLFLIDPQGRRLGRDPGTDVAYYSEIKAVTFSSMGESGVVFQDAPEGRYELQVTGDIASAPYALVVQAPDRTGKSQIARHANRTAEPGTIDRYEVVYSKASDPPVRLAPVRDLSRLTLVLYGAGDAVGDLVLTDPRARRTGLDPVASQPYRQIPRSSYLDEGIGQRTMVLDIRQPTDGTYALHVTGTAAGRYGLDVRARDRSGTVTTEPELRDIPTARGVGHHYVLDYSATARSPVVLGGGFDGGGQRSPDTNRLLTYANPASPGTRVGPGATTFPLLIFYGPSIDPATFNAMLNGTNASSRFSPAPGQHELVLLPVRPGSNALMLSVDGTTQGGQRVTDTDHLVLVAE